MKAREISLPWNEPLLTLGIPGPEGWAVGTLEMAFSEIGGAPRVLPGREVQKIKLTWHMTGWKWAVCRRGEGAW